MQSLLEWWNGVMAIEGARWIIYPALLAVLVLLAYYTLNLVRNLAVGQSTSGEFDYLGEFRRMRDEGHLDQNEYKKLTGLVPLPDTDTKNEDPVTAEGGAHALTEAAKEAIRRAAASRESESEAGTELEAGADSVGKTSESEETDEGNSDRDEHSAD